MIDLLLIGYSTFAQRRVLPAVATVEEIGTVHVASRSGGPHVNGQDVPRLGRVFDDYARALDQTPPCLAYISLHNGAHAAWAERALAAGHHVVVDKPAFTDLADAERLVALARQQSLVLAEATTYAFHPVVDSMLRIFREHGSVPTQATVAFTPPVPPGGYRHRRDLGGGALLDTGPYFASIGRLVFGGPPLWLRACVTGASDGVETSYSVLSRYASGTLIGHFGFTTEYRNWMHLAARALDLELSGIFSTRPTVETDITVRRAGIVSIERCPAADSVRTFLREVLSAVVAGDGGRFGDVLLADARTLAALRRTAEDTS